MIYTGIGARGTPDHILRDMRTIAANLELSGFKLRSGGANGADSAFETGVQDPKNCDIFLPWRNFNNNPSHLHDIRSEAYDMAEEFHPAWNRCSPAARKFHARNCYQVLGLSLDVPSDFVACWTPDGLASGGTGQALRIAQHHDIPVFNLHGSDWDDRFNDWLNTFLAQPAAFNFQGESS